MEQGEIPNKDGLIARAEVMGQRILEDAQLSRRAFLGLWALTTLEVGVLAAKSRLGIQNPEIASYCETDIRCHLEEAGLQGDIPEEFITSTIPEPTTTLPPTTLPPETTTTLPPTTIETTPQPELKPAPPREMGYGEFAAHSEQMLSLVPRLDQLHAMYPNSPLFGQVERQKQHIELLRQNIVLDPNEYNQFAFNTTFAGLFSGSGTFDYQAVLHHWAAGNKDTIDVPHFVQSIAGHASVQLYAHKDDVMYLLTPALDLLAGHAAKLNPFTLGIEYYTGPYDGVNSPIFAFTPARSKASIYATVHALRSRGKPVGPATILGHYAGDLIFQNPYYNPYEGTFHAIEGFTPPSIRKQDPPQEYIDMIVAKAMELDRQLG